MKNFFRNAGEDTPTLTTHRSATHAPHQYHVDAKKLYLFDSSPTDLEVHMHETGQVAKRSFLMNYLPIMIAVLSVMVLWGMKTYGIKIPTSILPWLPFRVDFIDAIYGAGLWFLVSGDGWAFAIPFIFALLRRSSATIHCCLFVVTALGVCFLNTFFNFPNPSIEIFMTALATYPVIFLAIAGVIALLKILILRSINFTRRLFDDHTDS